MQPILYFRIARARQYFKCFMELSSSTLRQHKLISLIVGTLNTNKLNKLV